MQFIHCDNIDLFLLIINSLELLVRLRSCPITQKNTIIMPEYLPNIKYRSPKEDAAVSTILFKNAKIFDGKSDAYLTDATDVLIEGNLISKVGTNLSPPEDSERVAVIDCEGKTLMPGLIDMHAHLCFQEGMLEGMGVVQCLYIDLHISCIVCTHDILYAHIVCTRYVVV